MRTTPFCFLLLAAGLATAEKVEILRDQFGVPHIFAATAAGAAFGHGYAQAEDRLEEMMRNFRKAEGTMAEAFGEEWLRHDHRQRMWRHRDIARQHYQELSPPVRSLIEAFVAGVDQYLTEHPGRSPAWAVKLEPWHVVALGRFTIWRWPESDIAADLNRAGIQPDPLPYAGSNQWLIAASRTAVGGPIAVIDPHLSWYGETRYFEARLYGGDYAYSGASRVGLPFPTLGHSRHISIAMTTGGPDTADVFEEGISGGKYKFQNQWRPLEIRREKIGVKNGDQIEWREATFEYTHHGPIVARRNGKAYAAANPYAGEFRLLEQAWAMVTSKNLAEMKKAMALRQYMSQNIMVGTVDGDIYYLRHGRAPIRAKGCDPSRPMPGASGACEWQGLHPLEDLVQVANPPQGYMQNCNIPPWGMMKDSPLVAERWAERPYLYNATQAMHQRGRMALQMLEAATGVTEPQAVAMAFSTEVYQAATWQARLRQAGATGEAASLILGWNRRSDADSRPALAYYLFKTALGEAGRAMEPPATLTDEQLRAAVDKAAGRLKTEFPPDAVYGTLFRVGRQGAARTWPVGGGTLPEAAMATLRAIGFTRGGREFVGQSGQTSTQIVILSKPPRSYMVLPLGESDHQDSPHYDDQAEKLFSLGRAKPTLFLDRKGLEKQVTARKLLTF